MKIYIRRISRRLKNLREERNFTQEELAERLGISRQSIISVERGRCLPSLPLALRISEIFQKSLEDLFLEEHDEKGGVRSMPRQLMPWTPFGDIDRIFEDEDWSSPRLRARGLMAPLINIRQTEKEIIITADIPGVREEDLQIEVGDDFVDISGERKEETAEHAEKDEGYFRKEVNYGSFQRRIPLPTEVIADKAEATIKEGQLRLVAPKAEPTKPKTTKIKIKKG